MIRLEESENKSDDSSLPVDVIDLATNNDYKFHLVHQYYILSGYLSPPTRVPQLQDYSTC